MTTAPLLFPTAVIGGVAARVISTKTTTTG